MVWLEVDDFPKKPLKGAAKRRLLNLEAEHFSQTVQVHLELCSQSIKAHRVLTFLSYKDIANNALC